MAGEERFLPSCGVLSAPGVVARAHHRHEISWWPLLAAAGGVHRLHAAASFLLPHARSQHHFGGGRHAALRSIPTPGWHLPPLLHGALALPGRRLTGCRRGQPPSRADLDTLPPPALRSTPNRTGRVPVFGRTRSWRFTGVAATGPLPRTGRRSRELSSPSPVPPALLLVRAALHVGHPRPCQVLALRAGGWWLPTPPQQRQRTGRHRSDPHRWWKAALGAKAPSGFVRPCRELAAAPSPHFGSGSPRNSARLISRAVEAAGEVAEEGSSANAPQAAGDRHRSAEHPWWRPGAGEVRKCTSNWSSLVSRPTVDGSSTGHPRRRSDPPRPFLGAPRRHRLARSRFRHEVPSDREDRADLP